MLITYLLKGRLTLLVGLGLAWMLAGCADDGPASAPAPWIDVSAGYRPAQNQLLDATPQAGAHLEHNDGVAQFRFDLSKGPWSYRPKLGVQRTIMGLVGYPDDRMDRSALLVDGARLENQSAVAKDSKDLVSGQYAVLAGSVYLGAERESALPRNVELSYAPRRGRQDGNSWAITGRRYSGRGLSIWPGESVTRPLQWSAGSSLLFATCAERLLAQGPAEGEQRVTFRVHQGDALLFEHELQVPGEGASAWHRVELLEAGSELRFSVSGDLTYSSFMAPVIEHAGAPTKRERSNVIVCQVDTLRADTLAPYGGQLDLAPNLERMMGESLVFQRAWSVGSYTLPAHASMMSGLYPRQAGIERDTSRLPWDVVTLAESLSAAGYRTGAVVDGGFVSQLFGMQQGFQWFEEIYAGFGSTAERVKHFLDAADGRPSFLFVQTFAVHSPYDVSEATREHFGERLKLDLNYAELMNFVEENGFDPDIWKNGKQLQQALDPKAKKNFGILVKRMRDLYHANIFEFDTQFAGFRADLEARDFFAPGQMLLVSDHGESFLRHHSLFHGNILHEEELRVPFFLYGSGIEPGLSQTPVSLVDLVPTVAALTGLESQPQWMGHSVLGDIPERTLYAFQCSKKKISTWVQIAGDKKWIGHESPESMGGAPAYAAFDLASDPGEQDNLLNSAAWAAEFSQRAEAQRALLFTPLFEQESSARSMEMDDVMRALGYLGDDEE